LLTPAGMCMVERKKMGACENESLFLELEQHCLQC